LVLKCSPILMLKYDFWECCIHQNWIVTSCDHVDDGRSLKLPICPCFLVLKIVSFEASSFGITNEVICMLQHNDPILVFICLGGLPPISPQIKKDYHIVKVFDKTPTQKEKKNKTMSLVTNVKIVRCHKFHGLRCYKVVMVKLNMPIV